LWQVERSFRMAKTYLRSRPIFHRQRDSIEAHLTIVFAALAISRHLQEQTGVSIKKLVNTLRTIRSATITLNGDRLTLDPLIPPSAHQILTALGTRRSLNQSEWHDSGQLKHFARFNRTQPGGSLAWARCGGRSRSSALTHRGGPPPVVRRGHSCRV
jgi:hypothetical protein